MTEFDTWAAKAHEGQCSNCGTEWIVFSYPRHPASPIAHLGPTMDLCFVCATVQGANAQEYPQQHPHHDHIVKPVLGAISLLFRELRKPKKPRKPRQPKGGKLSVMPMAPRRK